MIILNQKQINLKDLLYKKVLKIGNQNLAVTNFKKWSKKHNKHYQIFNQQSIQKTIKHLQNVILVNSFSKKKTKH